MDQVREKKTMKPIHEWQGGILGAAQGGWGHWLTNWCGGVNNGIPPPPHFLQREERMRGMEERGCLVSVG